MAHWLNAFLPTIALIALGIVLKARVQRDPAVWTGIEGLTFWVFLPCILASSISTIDLTTLPFGPIAATIWIPLAVATASALVLARMLGHRHAAMTSIVQGGIRFNTFVAFSIVAGLYGQPGLALGGVMAGMIVPVVQVVVTIAFASSAGGMPRPGRLARQLATNPLIIGCAVGFVFAAFGGMPPGLGPLVRSLGQAGLALGLLSVGAGLALGSLREAPLTQLLIGLQKLVAVPLLTFAIARLVGLDPLPTAIAVLFMAIPTAPTAYVMARAMGGDARLMAAMITLQHLAAIATVPVWALLLAG